MIAPSVHRTLSNSSKSESSNIDLLIALRKQPQSCTLHPISRFMSYNALSIGFRAFTSYLDGVGISRNIKEAFKAPKWRKAILEEMWALEIIKLWM